ncbi:MAG: hypothetical protein AAF821_06680 [Cyanobacteria bacterium P01_D01_bin.156]
MMAPNIAREAQQAITLIKSFSLELEQYSPESQVMYWLNTYRPAWIRDAVIEAVFQGRYKIISVEHILQIWQRRGQPVCHFTSGFEQTIASHLGSPIHMVPSTLVQSGIQQISDNRYNFAPSPLSSSVITQHFNQESIRDNHRHLAINAFPVKPINKLVDVYQANTPSATFDAQTLIASEDHKAATDQLPVVSYKTMPERGINASRPIQPFRPAALSHQS